MHNQHSKAHHDPTRLQGWYNRTGSRRGLYRGADALGACCAWRDDAVGARASVTAMTTKLARGVGVLSDSPAWLDVLWVLPESRRGGGVTVH